jgi:hypothetical protein
MSRASNLAGFTTSISSSSSLSVGIITATSFIASNATVTGIITASSISAQEFIGTGDNLIFSPTITSFSPTDGATGVNALSSPDIVLTYNQPVVLGVGTITLRTVSSSRNHCRIVMKLE